MRECHHFGIAELVKTCTPKKAHQEKWGSFFVGKTKPINRNLLRVSMKEKVFIAPSLFKFENGQLVKIDKQDRRNWIKILAGHVTTNEESNDIWHGRTRANE